MEVGLFGPSELEACTLSLRTTVHVANLYDGIDAFV